MSVRVALFGSGWIQRFHAQAVLDHPEGSLVAAANWREPSLRELAERFGIPRTTTDWRELAEDEGIDAVVIGTPNALHAEQAVACLRAGKHVLVEKPMATSVAECDAMIAAARSSGRFLMVGHCWRFHPAVRAAREAVASGRYGRIVKTRGYGIHVRWGPSGWFTDPALAGGGALIDMGVHAIDTARFVLGDAEPVRVCASIGTRYRDDYDVDDDGVLLVVWSNGATSIVESGWWQPHAGGPEADTELYGTLGYGRIFPETEPTGEEHAPQSMYSAQMAEFLEAIVEGRQPRPSGEEGREIVRVVEEAYRSAAGA